MHRMITVICCGSLLVASVAAQRRVPGEKPTVGVIIALNAGTDTYQFKGQARCTHAPKAAIYGVLSERWMVQHSDDSRSATLTLWKPKNGSGEMFSLSISSGSRSRRVTTVKASGAPAPVGSGQVTLAPSASAGTFTVDAKTADGTAITGTITCDAFLPAIAEGGN
jgi:hypothetical protein